MGAPLMPEAAIQSWLAMADDNMSAAGELERAGRHRSAVSRYYYSIHHAVHAVLIFWERSVPPRGNWRHRDLPSEFRSAVLQAEGGRQWARVWHEQVQNSYNLRVAADYKPRTEVSQSESSEARRYARAIAVYVQEIVHV